MKNHYQNDKIRTKQRKLQQDQNKSDEEIIPQDHPFAKPISLGKDEYLQNLHIEEAANLPLLQETIQYLQDAEDQNKFGFNDPDQPFDFDFYYRNMPESDFKPCFLPGVEEAKCFPNSQVVNDTSFCNDVNYPNICLPIDHFLWPLWTIKEKDFSIREQIALQVEERLLLELAEDQVNSTTVSGMELTSSLDCLQMYKQFTCRLNFPMCQPDTGKSEPICPSECKVFHSSCGLDGSSCSYKFFEFMQKDSESCQYAPQDEEGEEEE